MAGVPHDHPSVDSHAGEVVRAGRVDRPCVRVSGAPLPADVVRLVLGGAEYHADVCDTRNGAEVRGVYDTAAAARDRAGENRLVGWVESRNLDYGRTVHLDVVDDGYRYGLRGPGEYATYERTGAPDDSLRSIAEDL
jgi:hypothetical protein